MDLIFSLTHLSILLGSAPVSSYFHLSTAQKKNIKCGDNGTRMKITRSWAYYLTQKLARKTRLIAALSLRLPCGALDKRRLCVI